MTRTNRRLTEKLSAQLLVRFTETDHERLCRQAKAKGKETVEFIRDCTLAEVARREDEDALREVARLQDAGIDLKALVDYALARKAADEAQASLPGIFGQRGQL